MFMASKKQLVERILSDNSLENLKFQIEMQGRYLVTNGCVGLLLAEAVPNLPKIKWESCNAEICAKAEKVYNLMVNPSGYETLYGKLDLIQLKQYEKDNRFYYNSNGRGVNSVWIRFNGWNYPIKQVIQFLEVIKGASLSSYNDRPLLFWNGRDAGAIMPCAIQDSVLRFDKNGNQLIYDQYSVNYEKFKI